MLRHLTSRGVKAFLIVGKDKGTPLQDDPSAEDSFELLGTPIVKSERGKPLLDALLNASFARRYRTSSYPIFTEWEKRNERGWLRLRSTAIESISRFGSNDICYQWQIKNLKRFLRRTRDYSQIKTQLKTLRPALVISTKCTQGAETSYIEAAHDLGIETLNWVLSFDNLTSRGRLPLFDYYAVWNQRMKDQVLRLYPERKLPDVYVTGTPQFDFHVQPDLHWKRESVLQRLGLSRSDRYLLYAANCSEFTPTEPDLIEQFARGCAESADLKTHRIVVRLHPLDDESRWRRFVHHPSQIVLSRPWGQDGNSFGLEEQTYLVNTLLQADTCVNLASTMSLDAAVLNVPVVCVAFAGQHGGPEDRFCKRVYETEHYRPLIQSGGVRLAKDMDQLLAEVAAYVREPTRDEQSRKVLIQSEVGEVDGRASERVAALIARITRESLLRKVALT